MESQNVKTILGFPNKELMDSMPKPCLLLLDDFQNEITEKSLNDLACRDSHHSQISVIFVCQNLYGKNLRCAKNQASYYILMRSPAAMYGIQHLARQIWPKNTKYFLSAYEKAIKEPYSYLLISIHPAQDPRFALRSKIFPDDPYQLAYFPI